MDNDNDPIEGVWSEVSDQGQQVSETLAWDYARKLTSKLESGRRTLGGLLSVVGNRAYRLSGELADVADDIRYKLDPAPWIEEVYIFLGVASLGQLAELDERLDDLEVRIDRISRERGQGELVLLQSRIIELEQVLASVGDAETRKAVFELVDKLGSLETRIDSIGPPLRSV